MIITTELLKEKDACEEGVIWFEKNYKKCDLIFWLEDLIKKKEHLDWANWLIVRCMTRPQYLEYAIYAAEQVVDIFEKEYPDDKSPKKAIEATKKVLKNDTKENRAACAACAASASAAWAASASARAAWAASADSSAWAARAARAASAASAAWAASSASAARAAMQIKILQYGIKLLEEVE